MKSGSPIGNPHRDLLVSRQRARPRTLANVEPASGGVSLPVSRRTSGGLMPSQLTRIVSISSVRGILKFIQTVTMIMEGSDDVGIT